MLELPETFHFRGNRVRWGRIGGGPPLVAIHGTPFSAQVWRRIVPQFADLRTIYYFDMIGYGLSEMREGQDVSLGFRTICWPRCSRNGASSGRMFWRMTSEARRPCAPIT